MTDDLSACRATWRDKAKGLPFMNKAPHGVQGLKQCFNVRGKYRSEFMIFTDPPGREDSDLVAHSAPIGNSLSRSAPGPTPFDKYLIQHRGDLTPVGDFSRAVKVLGPGQTPARLRNYLIRRVPDLALLNKCDRTIAEFKAVERWNRNLAKQGGR